MSCIHEPGRGGAALGAFQSSSWRAARRSHGRRRPIAHLCLAARACRGAFGTVTRSPGSPGMPCHGVGSAGALGGALRSADSELDWPREGARGRDFMARALHSPSSPGVHAPRWSGRRRERRRPRARRPDRSSSWRACGCRTSRCSTCRSRVGVLERTAPEVKQLAELDMPAIHVDGSRALSWTSSSARIVRLRASGARAE